MTEVHYHTHINHLEARCEVMRRLEALDAKLDLMETKIMAAKTLLLILQSRSLMASPL